MSKRVCSEPGCPTIVRAGARGGRCTTHARAQQRQRGTTTALGWGWEHQQTREHWQRRIDAGEHVNCWRPNCQAPITGTHWHLGHDDHDRSITRGPECVTCNLSAAGRARHRPG